MNMNEVPCAGCRNGAELPFDFSMAFQPIVDVRDGSVFAYEALVRGLGGESAHSVLSQVSPENRYSFDQRCRVRAIEMAVKAGLLGTSARLSINFLPNAVYSAQACIQLTLRTAREHGLPLDRLIFEFTENEEMDAAHVQEIIAAYKQMGFATALDDFGAGYAGLSLLAKFQPDYLKIDMELTRGIDASRSRQIILQGLLGIAAALDVQVIVEGIETTNELDVVTDLGVRYVQGYYFAKPAFEALPSINPGA